MAAAASGVSSRSRSSAGEGTGRIIGRWTTVGFWPQTYEGNRVLLRGRRRARRDRPRIRRGHRARLPRPVGGQLRLLQRCRGARTGAARAGGRVRAGGCATRGPCGCPAADRAAAELLAAAGHKLDGDARGDGHEPGRGRRRRRRPRSPRTARSSARSTTPPTAWTGSFTAALAPGLDHPGMRVYLSGREASVVTLDVGTDCHVGLVATVPEAQRRGLAGRAAGRRPGRRARARAAHHHADRLGRRPPGLRAAGLPAAGRDRDVGAARGQPRPARPAPRT